MVKEKGSLIVFEGPDGTGKSTLADVLYRELDSRGAPVVQKWFPGRDDGTLGKLVYGLHQKPENFGVKEINPAALQALHVAAHLDIIEREIRPLLQAGKNVLLDRYWWSTMVYGRVSEVSEKTLRGLIDAEISQWDSTLPRAVFLIERTRSLKSENLDVWDGLKRFYRQVYETEKSKYPCFRVSNDGALADSISEIRKLLSLE